MKDLKNRALEELSAQGHYWMVNWKIVQQLKGFDEAVLLGYLCSMQQLFGNEKGVFYRTIPCVQKDTTLCARRQRKAIENLKELGLIQTDNIGIPRKRYFFVDAEAVKTYINNISSEHFESTQ